MIGETISHYEIVERIGAGGMGEVYRARDPRLDRDVAIKTLSASFGTDDERLKRFEREARAVASLNHPNVLAVYDVGTYEGVPYLVSELLDGETLRGRISAGGLTARKAVEYATQIADGLAAAHAKGVIHRDLKPENLFITREGHVKILDFGLAKLIQREPASRDVAAGPTASLLTEVGSVVGTVAYMSPEQLQGSVLDHRSDIFSFGVVLYEMLTGRRPFSGDTGPELAASILRDEPPDLSDATHPPAPTLERIVRQCLEKRPEDRFESARDLALVLRAVTASGEAVPAAAARTHRRAPRRWWGVVAAAIVLVTVAAVVWTVRLRSGPVVLPEQLSLAVLPLTGGGAADDPAPTTGGLRRSLADGLALVGAQTAGRMWVAPPGDHSGSLEEVRRYHNAALAVDGHVEWRDQKVNLRLDVLDVASGRRLRSVAISDDMSNLSCLQVAPVVELATQLDVPVTDATRQLLKEQGTNVVAACNAYLEGAGRLAAGDLDPAIASLSQAVDQDALFVSARTALAEALLGKYRATRDESWLERGISEVQPAAASSLRSPSLQEALADLYGAQGKRSEQVAALRRAAKLAPGSGAIQLRLAEAYARTGKLEDAEEAFNRAIRLRPGDAEAHNRLGAFYWRQRRDEAAINQFLRVTQIAPGNPLGFNNLGGLYLAIGDRSRAKAAFEKAVALEPSYAVLNNLGAMYYSDSEFGKAAKYFREALEMQDSDYRVWGGLGNSLRWAGDAQGAERALKHAVELGEKELASDPDDVRLLVDLAGYDGVLGNRRRGRALLERAVAEAPSDPETMGLIGESFEDLGEREKALEWIGKALDAGLNRDWVAQSPALNNLRADPRFAARAGGSDK